MTHLTQPHNSHNSQNLLYISNDPTKLERFKRNLLKGKFPWNMKKRYSTCLFIVVYHVTLNRGKEGEEG
jgi:hypothetical protein